MEAIRVLWNLVAVFFGIISIGVVIGAVVTGQFGFALFYLFFALILIVFCRI
jgi:hypothetical protein